MPDTYQGCEFIDLSLVDPDNRRPVDYQRRAAALPAELAVGEWKNAFTGEMVGEVQANDGASVRMADCLAHFPAALLIPANQ